MPAKAQEKAGYSIPFSFSIPGQLSGPSLRKVFSGIYEIKTGFEWRSPGGFVAGPYLHHSELKAGNSRSVYNSYYKTVFRQIGGGVYLGYSSAAVGPSFHAGVNVGWEQGIFSKLPNDTVLPPSIARPDFLSIQPVVSYRFVQYKNAAVGLKLGYRYMFYRFDPNPFGFSKYLQFDADDVKAASGFLTFGFVVTHVFGEPYEP